MPISSFSVAEMNLSHSDREMYGADGHVGHATTPGFPNPSLAPPYAAPYVVQYPDGTIRWSTGLCHCTDDPGNCKYPKFQLAFPYLFPSSLIFFWLIYFKA